ncbi:hypothetical protein M8J75_010649 [Diaphorina citri]|nr:hypothetical protein M8J75_010649 [Diaphorina citri]
MFDDEPEEMVEGWKDEFLECSKCLDIFQRELLLALGHLDFVDYSEKKHGNVIMKWEDMHRQNKTNSNIGKQIKVSQYFSAETFVNPSASSIQNDFTIREEGTRRNLGSSLHHKQPGVSLVKHQETQPRNLPNKTNIGLEMARSNNFASQFSPDFQKYSGSSTIAETDTDGMSTSLVTADTEEIFQSVSNQKIPRANSPQPSPSYQKSVDVYRNFSNSDFNHKDLMSLHFIFSNSEYDSACDSVKVKSELDHLNFFSGANVKDYTEKKAKYDPPSRKSPVSKNSNCNVSTKSNHIKRYDLSSLKLNMCGLRTDEAPSKWNQRHSLKCFQKEDTYAESNQFSENGTYVIERSQRSVRNCSKNSSGHSKTLMNVSSYHETEENDYAMSTSDISCEGNETDEDESYEDNEREAYNKEKRHIRNNFDNYSNNELNHSSISSVDKFKEERVVQDPQPFKNTKDNILEKYMTSKDSSNNLNTRISSSKCSGQFSLESLSQPETLLVNFHSKNNGDQMNESRRCSNNDSRRVRNQSPDCSDGLSNSHLIFSCVQRENFSVQKKKKTNEKFQHSRFTTIPPSSNNKTSVLSEENENLTSHILAQHFNSRHEEGGEPFKIALTNNDQQYNLNMNTNRSKEFKRTLSKCDERNFNQTEGVIVLFENKTAFNEMERVEIEKPIFKHVSMKRVSIKEYYKKTLYQPVTIHLTKYDIESELCGLYQNRIHYKYCAQEEYVILLPNRKHHKAITYIMPYVVQENTENNTQR